MPAEETEEAIESASKVASGFLATLGLLDIVLGSIGLYSVRLLCGPSLAALFPSTGLSVVDIALLASTAALTGRIVQLIVAFLMALLNTFVKMKDWDGHYSELKKALKEHCQATHRRAPNEKANLLDVAFACISSDSPQAASTMQQVRTEAIFAYGAALFSVPYGAYIYEHGERRTAVILTIIVCGLFFMLGVLQQLNYFSTARTILSALAPNEHQAKAKYEG